MVVLPIMEIPTFSDWVKSQFLDPYELLDEPPPRYLTIEKAKKIKMLLKTNMTTKQIALALNVKYHQVYYIQIKQRLKGN